MNYEKNIKELERITKKLSGEKMGIEEGLTLFEQGIVLAKDSLKELKELKGKMEILNKEMASLMDGVEPEETDCDE